MTVSTTVHNSTSLKCVVFFYGTLCVPAILARVLGHGCQNLTFQDALLPDYTRHCVVGQDYPAVIDSKSTRIISGDDVEDTSTRGTLVSGLSVADVLALDIFEGDEYTRKILKVHTFSSAAAIDQLPQELMNPNLRESTINTPPSIYAKKEAWVYTWSAGLDRLDPKVWSFAEFVKERADQWTGKDTTEFDEIEHHLAIRAEPGIRDEKSQSDFKPTGVKGKTKEGFPDFGRNMLKYWGFQPGYVNLNHGSYGSPPKPVIERMRALTDEIERFPDLFMRRTCRPMLDRVKQRVAKLIGADEHECVIVPNTTHGINTVMYNIDWEEGDVIVIYNTTYGAVGQTEKFICDKYPGVSLEQISITFPCSHEEVVKKTEDVLGRYNQQVNPTQLEIKPVGRGEKRVRMVVVDQIASNPGVVYPWEDIVRLCKKYGALSVVDAAHAIGQVKTNVKLADCDFWISNCHKWLMAHRGCSVLYVPFRNQHLMRTTFPTSHAYESSRYPTLDIDGQQAGRPRSFEMQYEWTGTQDWAPLLSPSFALDFREEIGGEERIMEYCHTLAVEGGKRIAERWETEVMDIPGDILTAAMVNVALPYIPSPMSLKEQYTQLRYIEDTLFSSNCFAPCYVHGGKWWTRFSAQVWNELEDFDYVANILEKACLDIKKGLHLQHHTVDTDHIHQPADVPAHDE
ncbi:hypothetical protein TREMEDRAFT_43923 [Tremella mesenterica DSM 1558]|uniref:uncharacterized protein n=1 Tax=Tremella mesenterica (strain ATCC 24925 / CBS 8224 / DSM 1558 / NBRC 9311 / NRRL Y-6157 / RJB 2259-6 / UBC 559-6) TaxID=578456 RepID=UPI0003F48CD3|nr:uncharacterized protein TREMEDRAFT_43923 [Tremella mesenterica DSM 1558]EIW69330.1 hypothetical protein TREMEDRAFT_43923 [Tremella mesenterica DSM 1558]